MPGVVYEDVSYEGYGPAGVAMYIEVVTDNKNRTVAEIRHAFSRFGGNLGENGSVAWMFEKKGMITVPKDKYSEEKLFEIALECGAEDVESDEDSYIIYTSFEDFNQVRNEMEDREIEMESAELTMIPQNTVEIQGKDAEQLFKLMALLDEHDDVQNVFANFEVDDKEMEKILNE